MGGRRFPPTPESSGLYRPAAVSVWCWIPTAIRFPAFMLLSRCYSKPLPIGSASTKKLIATHTHTYDRHQDFEDPDHGKELLDQRRAAREAKLLLRFYGLCPRAEEYYLQLKIHRLNPRQHIAKIMALSEVHGCDKIARAIEDSFTFQAFSSANTANI